MKHLAAIIPTIFLLTVPVVQAKELMRPTLIQTILLPNVEGRIDHLAIDLQGQRLFVTALSNNTAEVIDLHTGSHLQTLTGFHEPQAVLFLADLNKLAVTNGGDGTCQILDGSSFAVQQTIKVSDDADNVRYDAHRKLLYVGYGNGGIAVIKMPEGKLIGAVKLDAHPESFQLESSGSRIFINVPDAKRIVVADQDQRFVITTWPLSGVAVNFPMALDELHHWLFVGTRTPARLLIIDTESGYIITSLETVGDVDDVFYDAKHRRIYVSGGEGFLQIFEQITSDKYQALIKLPTALGARTSLFVPELDKIFIAVPHHGNQKAEIRVYDVKSLADF